MENCRNSPFKIGGLNNGRAEGGRFLKSFRRIEPAFLSSFPPRECGIAAYTEGLTGAINGLRVTRPPVIIAVNDGGNNYEYPPSVKFQIEQEDMETYREAAEYVNNSDVDLVHIQHEFGLFGGDWGEYITSFLERLEKPVITTLHTVFSEPSPEPKRILEAILEHSDYVTVISRAAMRILEGLYGSIVDKVRYIPHGAPEIPFMESETLKRRLGLGDRIVLSTFGLMSRGKGIEYAIRALPPLVKVDPRILYLVIGETHPRVRGYEGESYREKLMDLVEDLGLENHVRFENRFIPKRELIGYLQATDIFLLPYPGREQISSGALAYALGAGKAIVSTPFLHAREVISEGCAMECRFRDAESIADCIRTLLEEDGTRRGLEERAYKYSRDMTWPRVALKHVDLYHQALGV